MDTTTAPPQFVQYDHVLDFKTPPRKLVRLKQLRRQRQRQQQQQQQQQEHPLGFIMRTCDRFFLRPARVANLV
jgi:hypothetical protein